MNMIHELKLAALFLLVIPLVGALALGGEAGGAGVRPGDRFLVFVGTYTGAKSKGIYVMEFNSGAGTLGQPRLVAEETNPTFLTLHPNQKSLYSVGETGDFGGQRSGAVSVYALEVPSGKLTLLNRQPSVGTGPCHLVVDPTGKCVVVANYGGGSVAALPLGPDGALGKATAFIQHQGASVNPRRQEGPHAHQVALDPAGRFALVCDLGLDQVLVYRFDAATGALTPNEPRSARLAPGAGPRHLTFHPDGRRVYVINELDSTITWFRYDPQSGTLTEPKTVRTLPAAFAGQSTTAEIAVHPSGKFLYGSNRGHDSLAVFAIEPDAGELKLLQHQSTQGKTPRHFALDPTGHWLLAANQDSDSVVVFRLEAQGGRLSPTGQVASVGAPVCLQFVRVE